MRLFTAIDIPEEIAARIGELIERLKPAAPGRWSAVGNLHVTTKFVGNWQDARLSELQTALAAIPARAPVAVRVCKIGMFLKRSKPRSFWCGIEAPGLAELAADTDAAAGALGVKREERPFAPHITLARFKKPFDIEPLRQKIAAEKIFEFGAFEARAFYLYRSQLQRGGSLYTKLAEFPLAHS